MDGDAMNRHEYIRSDAPVLPGQPIIEGTRLPVDFLPGPMAEGWTGQPVLENDPQLCPAGDVRVCRRMHA